MRLSTNRRGSGTQGVQFKKDTSSSGIGQLIAMMGIQNKLQAQRESSLQQQSESIASAPAQVRSVTSMIPGGPPPGSEVTREGIKMPINREMTVEETKAMAGAEAINRHIDFIKGMQADPTFRDKFTKATFRVGGSSEKGQVFGFPTSFGDSDAMKLSFAIQDMSNRLLYLRSGAQINEKEFTRLSRSLPSMTDISDNDPTYSTLNFKLDAFKKDLEAIRNRIMLGGNYDVNFWGGNAPSGDASSGSVASQGSSGSDVRAQYNALRSQGVSMEEAKRRLGL